MPKSKWKNILDNKCPICSQDMRIPNLESRGSVKCRCGFRIGKMKYQKIYWSLKLESEGKGVGYKKKATNYAGVSKNEIELNNL